VEDGTQGMRVEESALVDGLKAGDDAAFAALIRLHGGPLLGTARRYLRNEEDARDVFQDAMLSAFRSIHAFQGESRLTTWLQRIVINASLMKLRTRRRRPEQSIDPLLPSFESHGFEHRRVPGSEWSDPAVLGAERVETRALVRDCIDRLPETYRTVLLLRDIDELDTEEVAHRLEISANAVKTRLHRARQALRGLLSRHMEGGPA